MGEVAGACVGGRRCEEGVALRVWMWVWVWMLCREGLTFCQVRAFVCELGRARQMLLQR